MARLDQDFFSTGIYTVPEAARLVSARYQKVRGWVIGYPNVKSGPIIHRQLERIGGKDTVGFLDLMEVRFIHRFSDEYGIKVRSLRRAFENARRLLKHEHPFATNAIKFRADTKKVFVEGLEEEGDPSIYDLMDDNFAFYDIVVDSLSESIEFSKSGEAELWHPKKDELGLIVLNPRYSFGQPIVEKSAVPTKALHAAYLAEGSYAAVADWFEVDSEEARQAVEFERQLAAA